MKESDPQIGDTVLCLDGEFNGFQRQQIPERPIEISEYTVRNVIYFRDGRKAILLGELLNPHLQMDINYRAEPSFAMKRFDVVKRAEIKETEESYYRELIGILGGTGVYLANA